MKKKRRLFSVAAACSIMLTATAGTAQIPLVFSGIQASAESIAFSCKLPPSGYDQERADTAKGKVT